ncbi:MAG: AAA family ATPase [Butyribacter sp.]|nr:AAA family ATPase [bacterium]MDY3855436.1 AAA family ATPase [Butyribacter sp.]
MNIKEAKKEIKNTVKAYLAKDEAGMYQIPAIRQRPVLLMGPPGIGKTQIIEQVARECQVALVSYTITHHTRQSAVGLPCIKEESYDGKLYSVTEYTMSEIIASIYEKMKQTGLTEGILFIDEINCVSETLAPTMLQFLQCKTFGNQKVPEGWIIVAAGNPPEYNKSVREFDMVTWDRVRRIDIMADYTIWREYAREAKVHSALLSYLELRPKNFYRIEADVDGLQFVTARGWEDLSNLMDAYEKLQIPVTKEVVEEFIHYEDVAEDVAAYLELYQKYQDDYGVEDILQGQVSTEVYQRLYQAAFDERLSVVHLLLDGLLRNIRSFLSQKALTDEWYAFLKEYRKQVEDAKDTKDCYLSLLEQSIQELEHKKAAGFCQKEEEQTKRQLFTLLRQYQPAASAAKEAFEEAKQGFAIQREALNQTKQDAIQSLEYAFDFMEEAFPAGEEMVVFVTELTISSESTRFFLEYPCERYLQYSEKLLIGTRRRELLSELEERE